MKAQRPALATLAVLMIGLGFYPLLAVAVAYLWSQPKAGHVLLLILGAVIFIGLSKRKFDFSAIRIWSLEAGLGKVIAVTCALILGLVLALFSSAWWVVGAPEISFSEVVSPSSMEKLLLRVAGVVGGLALVSALVINYRKQHTNEIQIRIAEQQEQRDQRQTWNENFRSAAEMLSDDHPAQRDAGIYLMSFLVDTAPSMNQAQVAVDVLCGRVRSSFDPKRPIGDISLDERSEQEEFIREYNAEVKFRETIIRLFRDRLHSDSGWQALSYDFTGAIFPQLDFSGSDFSGEVSFRGAVFLGGQHSFWNATFRGSVDFTGAQFKQALVYFDDANFASCEALFVRSKFSDSHFTFPGCMFDRARVDASWSQAKNTTVDFTGSQIHGTQWSFISAKYEDCEIMIDPVKFTGGSMHFQRAIFTSGNFLLVPPRAGIVEFERSYFHNIQISLHGPMVEGTYVGFPMITAKESNFNIMHPDLLGGEFEVSGTLSDSSISFFRSKLSGSKIFLTNVELHETEVSFAEIVEATGGSVDFTRSTGRCPEGLENIQSIIVAYGNWDSPGGPRSTRAESL
ncbi:pentapeptide repeat-containing protein [Nocardiopsis quinghaiensis]|uniref:pentapeptide repeat-containing protein n=1 Tax=Nocardiopsis quinghaiensis TaxID=464995 RepID=UPI001680080F|nr:pentapeptide repeat-containing protein [Nocardiopsis quinghaiensis]